MDVSWKMCFQCWVGNVLSVESLRCWRQAIAWILLVSVVIFENVMWCARVSIQSYSKSQWSAMMQMGSVCHIDRLNKEFAITEAIMLLKFRVDLKQECELEQMWMRKREWVRYKEVKNYIIVSTIVRHACLVWPWMYRFDILPFFNNCVCRLQYFLSDHQILTFFSAPVVGITASKA